MSRSPTLEEKKIDVELIKTRLGLKRLLLRQYLDNEGKFSRSQLYSDGHTLETVGLSPDKANAPVTDEEYFERLKLFLEQNGRLPKNTEKKKARLNFSTSRWSSINVFLEDAVKKGVVPSTLLKTRSPNLPTRTTLSSKPPIAMDTEPLVTVQKRELPPIPKNSK